MTISRIKDLPSSHRYVVVPGLALLPPQHPPLLLGLQPLRHQCPSARGDHEAAPIRQQLHNATRSRC